MAQPTSQVVGEIRPCPYQLGRFLGEGSYAIVRECCNIDTGRYFAAKSLDKHLLAGKEATIRNELAVLKWLKATDVDHPNILCMVELFETLTKLYIVMPLALGGELYTRVCRKRRYNESNASRLIGSITDAVHFLHTNGIVHRDLKPENILFMGPEEDSKLVITDFGLSSILEKDPDCSGIVGTPSYMAPEAFSERQPGRGKPVRGLYTYRDLWAIGVITYFLLGGYTPFARDCDLEETMAIQAANYTFNPIEYWRDVSQTARNFIGRCLTIDPAKRITAHEALKHPWIADPTSVDNKPVELSEARKRRTPRGKWHVAISTVRTINILYDACKQEPTM